MYLQSNHHRHRAAPAKEQWKLFSSTFIVEEKTLLLKLLVSVQITDFEPLSRVCVEKKQDTYIVPKIEKLFFFGAGGGGQGDAKVSIPYFFAEALRSAAVVVHRSLETAEMAGDLPDPPSSSSAGLSTSEGPTVLLGRPLPRSSPASRGQYYNSSEYLAKMRKNPSPPTLQNLQFYPEARILYLSVGWQSAFESVPVQR